MVAKYKSSCLVDSDFTFIFFCKSYDFLQIKLIYKYDQMSNIRVSVWNRTLVKAQLKILTISREQKARLAWNFDSLKACP